MKSLLLLTILAVLFSSSFAATFNPAVIEGQLSDDKKNIFRCVFDCLYNKVDLAEALRIIGKCMNVEEPLPCFAQEAGEHMYQGVSQCYQTKVQKLDESPCAEKVTKAREHFKGLDKEEKKEFVKKLYAALTKKYPTVCKRKIGFFIYSLLVRKIEAEKVCELYKKLFKVEEKIEGKCEEKVTKVRGYFKGLEKEEKKEFIKKLYVGLTKKYPTVERKKVGEFLKRLLFSADESASVCALYKETFLKPESKSVEPQSPNKTNHFRCVFHCLYEKLPMNEILRILGKCLNVEDHLPCFAQELGDHLFQCVSKCFGKSDAVIVKQEVSCPEKVTKVRDHFKGLERDGKREFYKRVVDKLKEKYPNTCEKKIEFFAASLVFDYVSVDVPCKLYTKLFK